MENYVITKQQIVDKVKDFVDNLIKNNSLLPNDELSLRIKKGDVISYVNGYTNFSAFVDIVPAPKEGTHRVFRFTLEQFSKLINNLKDDLDRIYST